MKNIVLITALGVCMITPTINAEEKTASMVPNPSEIVVSEVSRTITTEVSAKKDVPTQTEFELAGFKPGMNWEQALEKVNEFTGGDEKMVRSYKGENKLVDNAQYVRKLELKKDKTEVNLEFVPSVESDTLILFEIVYRVPRTEENIRNLLQAAYKKFGDPKRGDKKVSESQQWCEELAANRQCSGVTLKYSSLSSYLTLSDREYVKQYQDEANKAKIEL